MSRRDIVAGWPRLEALNPPSALHQIQGGKRGAFGEPGKPGAFPTAQRIWPAGPFLGVRSGDYRCITFLN